MVAPIFIRVFQEKKKEMIKRENKLRPHLSWNIHPSNSIQRLCGFSFSTLGTPVG